MAAETGADLRSSARSSAPRARSSARSSARSAALAGVAALTAALAGAPEARAADDGVYGRFDGDLELRAGAGASFATGGPALCARAAAAYLGTAGLYLHYNDALGEDAAPIARSIAGGVFIQPLFLGRYASDLEHGPPTLDLFLDSIALGVGSFWEAPLGHGLEADPGLELSLSVDVPLLAHATGAFLGVRGALRWSAPALAGVEGARDEQRALVSVTLSWHHVLRVHLVDAGDRVMAARSEPRRVAKSGRRGAPERP